MAVEKQNGDMIQFIKQKDYVMVNNHLGNGSFGKTVLLKDPFIDELFVAKKYEPEYDTIREAFFKNFLDEIRIMYKLNHRNIVRIYNYYAYEKNHLGYILMEYIEGETIDSFIMNYPDAVEGLTLDEVFIQLIDAFCYLESNGVIHRDIREGNILVDKNGVVKVIDFGIGKMFTTHESDEDSLVDEINRGASDTLPQEYYEGIYSHLTDMFYLAELFNRLLDEAGPEISGTFSYRSILKRMMEKQPHKRYQSFLDIRDAVGKHDFLTMNISDKDKAIYRNFSDTVYSAINHYRVKPKFHSDPESVILKLHTALSNNVFETYIQNNADIISSIVACSYNYNRLIRIETQQVKTFVDWLSSVTPESQELIINNLISKLSNIRVIYPETDDLPF